MFSTKRKKSFFVPLTAFALVIAVSVVMLVGRVMPLIAAERALVNLGGDMTQRLSGSPFGALPLIFDALEDGVVSVSFEFADRFASGSFDIEFHSDEANRLYKLVMDFDVDGFAFDLELYLDRYHIVATSSVLGEEFYGLTFATFRNDFAPIAQLLGLSDADVNEIVGIVEIIGNTMNTPEVGLEVWEPYFALFNQFILGGTVSSENLTIESRGQEVNVTRAEFRFSQNDMVSLLRNFLTTMSLDANMDPFGMIEPWVWDELIRELDLPVASDGSTHLIMYIGPQNRLMKLDMRIYSAGPFSATDLHFTADFGTSVFDTWYISLVFNVEWPSWFDASLTEFNHIDVWFVWNYSVTADRHVNTIDVSTIESTLWHSWDGEYEITTSHNSGRFVSDWNSTTGAFVLAFTDDDSDEASEVSGIYRPDEYGGFLLRFDWADTEFDTFSLEISAQTGADIQPVRNFINFSDMPISALLELLP